MHRHACLAAIAFLLLGCTAEPAAAQPTGGITGTVTDVASGAPLPNVSEACSTAIGSYAGTAYSESSGVYALSGLAPGTYYLRTVEYPPYLAELYDDLLCSGGTCSPTAGTPVVVAAGQVTGAVNFALQEGGTITGQVTDAGTGAPLAGITVKVMATQFERAATTDASGVYTVTGLPTRDYYVFTSQSFPYLDELYAGIPCANNDCQWWVDGTPVSVTAGAVTSNVDIALTHGGTITGVVTDAASGAPIEGAGIWVESPGFVGGSRGMTDAAGAFSVTGLATGTYYVRVSMFPYLGELYDNLPCPDNGCDVTAGKAISVTAGETAAGISIALTRGGTITGTVTDAVTGAPLSNISVALYSASGASVAPFAATDLSGVYTHRGLTTAAYYLRTAYAFPYHDELYDNLPCPNGSCTVTAGQAVSVTVNTTTSGIDFALVKGGTIAGTVTDAGTGAALPDVWVAAHTTSGELAGSIMTNGSGAYALGGLQTGTYYVRASNRYPYLGELYNNVPCPGGNCAWPAGTAVAVTTGATTSGIDFSLARGGTITGTVTAAGTGAPISGVLVYVYTSSREGAGQGWTDASGVYSVDGLAPGTYYLRTQNGAGYWDEAYDNVPCRASLCDPRTGTGVTAAASATTSGIDFVLDRGGTIAGTVTAASTGAPLPNVQVRAYAAGGATGGQGMTDASGSFSIPFLDPGTYFLHTVNALPYLDEVYDDRPCPGGSCNVLSGTPVSVNVNATTSGINFSLAAGGSIAGTVTHGLAGAPLADVLVAVLSESGALAGSDFTNASGVYEIAGLAAGTWYVRASRGQPYVDQMYKGHPCQGADCTPANGTGVSVTSGAVTAGIDFALGTAVRSDFDGDFKSDILWWHDTLGEVWQWPMDGARKLSETYVRTVPDTTWEIRGLGDQDGSFTADLLWRNTASGQVYVWPMTGAAPAAELYVATVEPAYDIAGTGDLDGDGNSDIVWRNLTNGEVWIWRMNAQTKLSETYVGTVDPAYVVQGVGDLDGDAKADLVWHHGTTGDVWVWLMDGTTKRSETWIGAVPDTGYRIQGVADFTGDARADLVWHHATTGEVWIWSMDGTTRLSEAYVAAVPETGYRIVGTGDYDGNGKADLLWHHATRGEVWVWPMDGTTHISETWVGTVPDTGYRIIRR